MQKGVITQSTAAKTAHRFGRDGAKGLINIAFVLEWPISS